MTYVRTEKHNGKYKWIHLLKCLYCTTPYERIAANKSPKSNGWCSKECRKAWHKSQSRLNLVCKNCEREFEVYNYQKHYTFCSHKCYHKHIKDNPEQYNLYQKAAKARSNSNTLETFEKMRETKLAKGIMIDWKDATWKQYWKRCNDLTRKMRSMLLEGWDGLDYIDGKYIKDNLALHYSHGDYPTLDHITPRSECYKQGLTPYEACSPDNLKWTTRRNNSSKYNKQYLSL